jgi:hypothetical protein
LLWASIIGVIDVVNPVEPLRTSLFGFPGRG